jgi:curved DNA-binding protein CbpA
MEELLEMSRKESHYEVLGILRTARPEEIKRAYHSIARRLHPDRFRRDAAGEFVRQLDVSFARVTQAYEVLKDPSMRASYDLKLSPPAGAARSNQSGARAESERGGQTGGDDVARGTAHDEPPSARNAEEKFTRGLEALRKGDYATARSLFGEAALVVPRQARYRAYYGRELARDRATRRQAEAELQAAVSLDEKNPSYRVMLAELYLEVGLRRRAEGELRRALDIAPGHEAALRLLKKLGASA